MKNKERMCFGIIIGTRAYFKVSSINSIYPLVSDSRTL